MNSKGIERKTIVATADSCSPVLEQFQFQRGFGIDSHRGLFNKLFGNTPTVGLRRDVTLTDGPSETTPPECLDPIEFPYLPRRQIKGRRSPLSVCSTKPS